MKRSHLIAVLLAIAVSSLPTASDLSARPHKTSRCLKFEMSDPQPEGIDPPRELVGVPAAYPLRSDLDDEGGAVVVEFTVTKEGRVLDAKIVCADPKKRFENAALTAIRQFEFVPATRNGTPVDFPGVQKLFIFDVPGVH